MMGGMMNAFKAPMNFGAKPQQYGGNFGAGNSFQAPNMFQSHGMFGAPSANMMGQQQPNQMHMGMGMPSMQHSQMPQGMGMPSQGMMQGMQQQQRPNLFRSYFGM